MRWRLYLFLILGIVSMGVSWFCGYLWAYNEKFYLASMVLLFLALDAMLLAMAFAQDDGAQVEKKNTK